MCKLCIKKEETGEYSEKKLLSKSLSIQYQIFHEVERAKNIEFRQYHQVLESIYQRIAKVCDIKRCIFCKVFKTTFKTYIESKEYLWEHPNNIRTKIENLPVCENCVKMQKYKDELLRVSNTAKVSKRKTEARQTIETINQFLSWPIKFFLFLLMMKMSWQYLSCSVYLFLMSLMLTGKLHRGLDHIIIVIYVSYEVIKFIMSFFLRRHYQI